ncbi:MAG: hypothetical protein HDS20_06015 [Bacteroides sp.]|nr:hypothetical protein [Bacteroides sp.]
MEDKNSIQYSTKKEVLSCACNSIDHTSIIEYDEAENQCYLSVHLRNEVWYKRIWHAIKHIFGFKSAYGDFDEFIWDVEVAKQIAPIINKMIEKDKAPIK